MGYLHISNTEMINMICAADPNLNRQSQMLHTLYIRGRHNMISTIIAIQKSLHYMLFVQAYAIDFRSKLKEHTRLRCFFRNAVAAALDKTMLLDFNHTETSERYSCLNVKQVKLKMTFSHV